MSASLGNNAPTEQQIAEYVRLLTVVAPAEAAAFIENGWAKNQIPVDEMYVREYIKAVAAIKRLDSIQVCICC